MIRIQKILSNYGVTSRRKAEEKILLGQVKLNGKTIYELGTKADPEQDVITVDGKVINGVVKERVWYLLNKPRSYICTTDDPQGRPTVMDLMAGLNERVYPVGRLDYASEGLLLFTNDGDGANKVMHPSTGVVRRYSVKIRGTMPDAVIAKLKQGIQLKDGFVKPLRVFKSADSKLNNKEWINIELCEGKNLEIRRIFAAVGFEVDRLRRTAIGALLIGDVAVGKFRKLKSKEIDCIFDKNSGRRESNSRSRKRSLVPHSSRRGN